MECVAGNSSGSDAELFRNCGGNWVRTGGAGGGRGLRGKSNPAFDSVSPGVAEGRGAGRVLGGIGVEAAVAGGGRNHEIRERYEKLKHGDAEARRGDAEIPRFVEH